MKYLILMLLSLSANAAVTCVHIEDQIAPAVNGHVRIKDWKWSNEDSLEKCKYELAHSPCLGKIEHKKDTYFDGAEDGAKPEVQEYDEFFVKNTKTREEYHSNFFFSHTDSDLYDKCNLDNLNDLLKNLLRPEFKKSWNVRE